MTTPACECHILLRPYFFTTAVVRDHLANSSRKVIDQRKDNLHIAATRVEGEQRAEDRCALNLTNRQRYLQNKRGKAYALDHTFAKEKNDAIKKFRRE